MNANLRSPVTRTKLTIAEFVIHWLDPLMPTRWKLASKEMRAREWELLWVSRPRLRQKLKEAFDALGLKAPLDHPMPPSPDKLLRAIGIHPPKVKKRFAEMNARSARA